MPDEMTPLFDTILRGTLITPAGPIENGWLAISAGRIAALGQGPHAEAAAVRDYGNACLMFFHRLRDSYPPSKGGCPWMVEGVGSR